jgi:uncharacterized paraquat-inducible protein A
MTNTTTLTDSDIKAMLDALWPNRNRTRKPAAKWEACQGSYAQVALSVADEDARRARCPRCSKMLNVRPTRNNEAYAPNPSANIPRHKEANK